MNASTILLKRIRELHKQAETLRSHAAIIEDHVSVMTAALREIDPSQVVELRGPDGKPRIFTLEEISVPYAP